MIVYDAVDEGCITVDEGIKRLAADRRWNDDFVHHVVRAAATPGSVLTLGTCLAAIAVRRETPRWQATATGNALLQILAATTQWIGADDAAVRTPFAAALGIATTRFTTANGASRRIYNMRGRES